MIAINQCRRMMHLFTRHPDSVGESYLEHMAVALWYATFPVPSIFLAVQHDCEPGRCGIDRRIRRGNAFDRKLWGELIAQ